MEIINNNCVKSEFFFNIHKIKINLSSISNIFFAIQENKYKFTNSINSFEYVEFLSMKSNN